MGKRDDGHKPANRLLAAIVAAAKQPHRTRSFSLQSQYYNADINNKQNTQPKQLHFSHNFNDRQDKQPSSQEDDGQQTEQYDDDNDGSLTLQQYRFKNY